MDKNASNILAPEKRCYIVKKTRQLNMHHFDFVMF